MSLEESGRLRSCLLRHWDAVNLLVVLVDHNLVLVASKSSFAAFFTQTELVNGDVPRYLDVLITLKKRCGIVYSHLSLFDNSPSIACEYLRCHDPSSSHQ